MLLLDIDNTQVSLAISWVSELYSDNTDDIAHKVLLLSMAGEDTSSDLSTLLTFQSSDNGWGVDQEFSGNPLDTALALQAINAVNYSDEGTINYALSYLISTQNSDGGWAFRQAQDDDASTSSTSSGQASSAQSNSNVYMTAMVLKTLNVFSSTFNVQSSKANAVAYLLTNQNVDGGFGSSSSTVYETALAFEALVASALLEVTSLSMI